MIYTLYTHVPSGFYWSENHQRVLPAVSCKVMGDMAIFSNASEAWGFGALRREVQEVVLELLRGGYIDSHDTSWQAVCKDLGYRRSLSPRALSFLNREIARMHTGARNDTHRQLRFYRWNVKERRVQEKEFRRPAAHSDTPPGDQWFKTKEEAQKFGEKLQEAVELEIGSMLPQHTKEAVDEAVAAYRAKELAQVGYEAQKYRAEQEEEQKRDYEERDYILNKRLEQKKAEEEERLRRDINDLYRVADQELAAKKKKHEEEVETLSVYRSELRKCNIELASRRKALEDVIDHYWIIFWIFKLITFLKRPLRQRRWGGDSAKLLTEPEYKELEEYMKPQALPTLIE